MTKLQTHLATSVLLLFIVSLVKYLNIVPLLMALLMNDPRM